MRNLTKIILSLVLAACGSPPETPSLAYTSELPYALTLPVQYAAAHEILVYADRRDGTASEDTTLSYALADGYPRQVTLAVPGGYALGSGCRLNFGAVVWRSIVDQQGTAAQLQLVDGKLAMALREEGTVSVLLAGEIHGQHCTDGSGAVVTTVPLQHRLVLQVHRVAGFVVEQARQPLSGCLNQLVLPSGVPFSAPAVFPLNAAGQRFDAVNAPVPAAVTLRSAKALVPGDDPRQLVASAGAVAITVDTALPVLGLRTFTVVDPAALTSVQVALYLNKAVTKGVVVERITEGMAHRLFFPEQKNSVELRVEAAMTAQGKLCTQVPGAWFAVTSATPAQCPARTPDPAELFTPIPVATIGALGGCRLDVTIPGTSWRWTTQFSTTL